MHDLAGWLDQRDPGELLDEVRGIARRKPGTFLLGALAAGVVAGRLTRGAVDASRSDTGAVPPPTYRPHRRTTRWWARRPRAAEGAAGRDRGRVQHAPVGGYR